MPIIIFTTIFITACAPIYTAPDITKTVAINSDESTNLHLCKKNEWYRLIKDRQQLVHVAYGQRVSIGNWYRYTESDGYVNRTISCFPKLSFIPKPGNRYFFNFYIDHSTCHAEILRYSKNNKTGLTLEETVSDEIYCLP